MQPLVWECELVVPQGDGNNPGLMPTIFAAKNAAWEQEGVVYVANNPGIIAKIGSEDEYDPKSLHVVSGNFALRIYGQYKRSDAAHGGPNPWNRSAMRGLAMGETPQSSVDPSNPMYRPYCVIFGFEDNIEEKDPSFQHGDALTYQNLRLMILLPFIEGVKANPIAMARPPQHWP